MKKLLKAAGGNASAIARVCGVSPQAVHLWGSRCVPLRHVSTLCKVYKLTPHDIRPDVFTKEGALR